MTSEVLSVTLRRHPRWVYAKEGGTAVAEVVLKDKRVVGLEVATPANLSHRIAVRGDGCCFGAPLVVVERFDGGVVRTAVEDMLEAGGDWLWLLQAQALLWAVCEACVESRGRGMSSPLLARSDVLARILEPGAARAVKSVTAQRGEEPDIVKVRVELEDGTAASFRAATPGALARRMTREGVPFHYGPPVLYMAGTDDAALARAVGEMARHGGYALRLYHSLGDLDGAAGEVIRRLGLRV